MQGSGDARLTHTIIIFYNELIVTVAINPTAIIALSSNIIDSNITRLKPYVVTLCTLAWKNGFAECQSLNP